MNTETSPCHYSIAKMLAVMGFVFVYCTMISETSTCSTVGRNSSHNNKMLSGKFFKRYTYGLYLISGAPSTCDGIGTSWHFRYKCFEPEFNADSFKVVMAVYRPLDGLSYEMVAGSYKQIEITCDRSRSSRRVRSWEEVLQTSEQFFIHKNDIIAVCIPTIYRHSEQRLGILQILDDDIRPKRNKSSETNIHTTILEKVNKNDIQDCELNAKINMRDLKAMENYYLDIYIEISGITIMPAF